MPDFLFGELLSDLFNNPTRDRGSTYCKYYYRFRRLVQKLGTSYTIASDNYIEVAKCDQLPRGFITPHYDWGETSRRLKICVEDPSLIDDDGHYGE